MIIIENEYVEVSIQHEAHMLIKYKKFCPSEVFRAFWEQIPQYVLEHKIYKFLVDSRKMGVIAPKDQQWLTENILSLIEKNIIKNNTYKRHTAVIIDKNIFAELSNKLIFQQIHEINPNFDRSIEYFENEKKAVDWLMSVK